MSSAPAGDEPGTRYATASRTLMPSVTRRCVNSTIRMLFETTIPTIITTPISDCTFSVVPDSVQRQRARRSDPGGTASRMMNGSTNDRNCATRIKYSSTTASSRPMREASERRAHALHHAAQVDASAFGHFRLGDDAVDPVRDRAEILAATGRTYTSMTRRSW